MNLIEALVFLLNWFLYFANNFRKDLSVLENIVQTYYLHMMIFSNNQPFYGKNYENFTRFFPPLLQSRRYQLMLL